MKCPICDSSLKTKRVKNQGIEIDQCSGCKGIWFDANELTTVLGNLASGHEHLPKGARKRKDANCPRCKEALHEHPYPGTSVKVHSCKSCQGIWLDHSELSEIRNSRKDNLQQLVSCPNCKHEQVGGAECQQCGIIFAKFTAAPAAAAGEPNNDISEGDTDNPVENLFLYLADSTNLQDRRKLSRYIGTPTTESERLDKYKINRNTFIAIVVFLALMIPFGYVDGPNPFRPCEHWAPGSKARCMVHKDGPPWEVFPGYYAFFLTLVGVTSLPFAWQTFYYRQSRWRKLR